MPRFAKTTENLPCNRDSHAFQFYHPSNSTSAFLATARRRDDRVGGQRGVIAAYPAAHVTQVVVDVVVDLVLHPNRGRLGEPGVLVGVVAELEDVAVLVGEGDLEVGDR